MDTYVLSTNELNQVHAHCTVSLHPLHTHTLSTRTYKLAN